MGDATCRPAYLDLLRAYLHERHDELCNEHRDRIDENPLRVLDCKRAACRAATADAPRLIDHLCDECRVAFERVQTGLAALEIPFVIEPRLVRGLDYYTRTTFEFAAGALEAAQNGIGGGGRYDRLVEEMGGPPASGIGFGSGIERILLACDAEEVFPAPDVAPTVFVVDVTDGSSARDLTTLFRRAGIGAERAFDGRSMKSQMKHADRSGATFALIVGEREVADEVVTVRELASSEQVEVKRKEIVDWVRERLP
jgi:histidyl-tRNA synthetase